MTSKLPLRRPFRRGRPRKLLRIAIASSLTLAVVACGDTESTPVEPPTAREWEAGDIDPYGCPFIDPVPWEGHEAHASACGEGCEPTSTQGTFIACLGEEVPTIPRDVFLTGQEVCLTHPVNGADYRLANLRAAFPLMHLCWRACGSDEPFLPHDRFDGMDFNPPLACVAD